MTVFPTWRLCQGACAQKSDFCRTNSVAFAAPPWSWRRVLPKRIRGDFTWPADISNAITFSGQMWHCLQKKPWLVWTTTNDGLRLLFYDGKWNEYVAIAVNRNLSNYEKARKKGWWKVLYQRQVEISSRRTDRSSDPWNPRSLMWIRSIWPRSV